MSVVDLRPTGNQKATNYDYLSDEAEKGSASRSIYIVQAKELTPEIREHCIPIQLNPAEACSATTGVDSVTWNDLISLGRGQSQRILIPACIAHIRRNVTEWKDQVLSGNCRFTCCKRNHLLDVFSKASFSGRKGSRCL